MNEIGSIILGVVGAALVACFFNKRAKEQGRQGAVNDIRKDMKKAVGKRRRAMLDIQQQRTVLQAKVRSEFKARKGRPPTDDELKESFAELQQ